MRTLFYYVQGRVVKGKRATCHDCAKVRRCHRSSWSALPQPYRGPVGPRDLFGLVPAAAEMPSAGATTHDPHKSTGS